MLCFQFLQDILCCLYSFYKTSCAVFSVPTRHPVLCFQFLQDILCCVFSSYKTSCVIFSVSTRHPVPCFQFLQDILCCVFSSYKTSCAVFSVSTRHPVLCLQFLQDILHSISSSYKTSCVIFSVSTRHPVLCFQFLQDILDALFNILMHSSTADRYDNLVFDALVCTHSSGCTRLYICPPSHLPFQPVCQSATSDQISDLGLRPCAANCLNRSNTSLDRLRHLPLSGSVFPQRSVLTFFVLRGERIFIRDVARGNVGIGNGGSISDIRIWPRHRVEVQPVSAGPRRVRS